MINVVSFFFFKWFSGLTIRRDDFQTIPLRRTISMNPDLEQWQISICKFSKKVLLVHYDGD